MTLAYKQLDQDPLATQVGALPTADGPGELRACPESPEGREPWGLFLGGRARDWAALRHPFCPGQPLSRQEEQSRVVRQFHFHGWPEIGIPAEGKGMIDLIAAVQKQQQQTGNHPITVHCR